MHRPILPAILLLTSLQAGCSILFDRADEPRQVDDAGINDAATDDLDADTRLVLGPVETLSGGTAHASYSNVVFDGSDYRVIWEDGKDGSGGEVYARTIGSAQTVRITTTGGTKPSSVWNGNSLAIAWADGRAAPASLYAGVYDENNQLIGSQTRVSEGLDGITIAPSLTATGTQVGVTWFELELTHQVVFARLSGTGALLEPPQILQSEAAVPTIAFNGSLYGLAWHGTSDRNIFFRRMLATGIPAGAVVQLSSTGDSLLPAVASNGLDFAVVYQEASTSLFFVPVPAMAQVGAPVQITGPEAIAGNATMAWSGDAYGIAWQDTRDGRSEIYFREFDTSGMPIGDEVQLSDGLADSVDPSLVHSGSEYGASWQMGPSGTQVIQFRTITP